MAECPVICRDCGDPAEPGMLKCREHLDADTARNVARAERRKAQGMCTRCGVPAVPGKTMCEKHLASVSGWAKNKADAARAAGLCAKCAATPAADGSVWCSACDEALKATRRRRYQGRKGDRVCIHCGEPAGAGTECTACRTSARERGRVLTAERRASGLCVQCGEPAIGGTISRCAAHAREAKGRNLHRNYGLSVEAYDAMLSNQGGVCAICATDRPGGRGANAGWHVDHDHETGAVRGLLCQKCNLVLGFSRDREEVLVKAAGYLRKHRAARLTLIRGAAKAAGEGSA